jgi:AcrR family transcriptional regulator
MPEVKRSYDASRRREQARARRLAVVLAARELFERDGFRRTTIAAVATHAGVSAESVYKGFGTKAALAKAVFDVVIAGDDEPVPVAERPAAQAMGDEPDVRRKIAMFVDGLVQRQARSAKVQILIRDGRHVDDSLAPVWAKLNDEGLAGMTPARERPAPRGDRARRGPRRAVELPRHRQLRTAGPRPGLAAPAVLALACPGHHQRHLPITDASKHPVGRCRRPGSRGPIRCIVPGLRRR